MVSIDLESLTERLVEQTKNQSARELIDFVLDMFGDKIAFATSFGAEDQVLTDMLCKTNKRFSIFTLDTGRLPQQTYDVMQATREKYKIQIDVLFPDYKKVEAMVDKYGPNLFYESVELRKLCCKVRKIEPLKRKLRDLNGWICGLRAEQSITRTGLKRIEYDTSFSLIKVSPLIDWTTQEVWSYIHENNVPYNKLHDRGYPSIGCVPCSRGISSGEDIRAGRWWWESPEHKECGLHLDMSNKKGSEDTGK